MREYRYTNPMFSDISYPLAAVCFPKGPRYYLPKRGLFSLNLPVLQNWHRLRAHFRVHRFQIIRIY